MIRAITRTVIVVASWATAAVLTATATTLSPDRLKQLSLDELMELEVTSVSKSEQRFESSAAALTVVTAEHIRRSGATHVAETLRSVPGLHVARRNASSWAVSARGFSSTNSEKLLVLSDTRSIYTPLFSGVSWDTQDYLLADIDRIEVIRGPGAALWGSNAVNGVINITTKSAMDTQGTLIESTVGTEDRAIFAVRHGARTSQGVHFRVFAKYAERDETLNTSESSDEAHLASFGFRSDWTMGGRNSFTVQGGLYDGSIGQLAPSVTIIGRDGPQSDLKAKVSGGNILGRWRHQFDNGSDFQVRAYYDRTRRDDDSFNDELDTIDLDLDHRFALTRRVEMLWGANYRHTSNRNLSKGIFALDPALSDDELLSAFVQVQARLGETIRLTAGTKWEENDFSGSELQPGARAVWEPAARHTFWVAVSKAARTPTRLERDVAIDVTDPAGNPVVRLLGNRNFTAEELIAMEAGYRWRATDRLHLDLAVFENHYDKLDSLEFGAPFVVPADGRTVIPIRNENLTSGRARGAELLITASPVERWNLSASYSYLHLRLDPAGQDLNRGVYYDGATPRHQFALSSYLTLPGGFEFDAHFRRHTALRRLPEDSSEEGIPGYSELDLRLAWRVSERVELAVVGQNLLQASHLEFGSPAARGEIQRSVYAKLTWEL
jgi:iron complex outermembrane receptor protein